MGRRFRQNRHHRSPRVFRLQSLADLALLLIGAALRWPWILNPWFRIGSSCAAYSSCLQNTCFAHQMSLLNVLETNLRSSETEAVRASDGIGKTCSTTFFINTLFREGARGYLLGRSARPAAFTGDYPTETFEPLQTLEERARIYRPKDPS